MVLLCACRAPAHSPARPCSHIVLLVYCRAQQQQQQKCNWLVFNDFHITPSLADEATELYGGQKMPCLLYYTQVSADGRAVSGRADPGSTSIPANTFVPSQHVNPSIHVALLLPSPILDPAPQPCRRLRRCGGPPK